MNYNQSELPLDSIEQLHLEFCHLSKIFSDDSSIHESAESQTLIPKLKLLEFAIRDQALISSNEDIDHMDIDHIRFLNLPFYLASAYQNYHTGRRIDNLQAAEKYYLTFFELMSHFSILPSDIQHIYDVYSLNKKYEIQREEKIKLYKDEKIIKEQIELAENKQEKRTVEKLVITKNCYKAINNLLFLPQEMELMKYRETLETDEAAKKEWEKLKMKPVEPLKFWKLETGQETQMGTINSKEVRPVNLKSYSGFANTGGLLLPEIKTTDINVMLDTKQLILDKLNQPCFAQPKMTLDQHDELEYQGMIRAQQKQAKGFQKKEAEKAKYGIVDSSDSENEHVSDAKTYKNRNWDDYKDANEKGSGNRAGK